LSHSTSPLPVALGDNDHMYCLPERLRLSCTISICLLLCFLVPQSTFPGLLQAAVGPSAPLVVVKKHSHSLSRLHS
jgi:hypothetical protein